MGISIDVESIITHPSRSRRRPGPHQRFIVQQEHVRYICEIFGWTTPPWNEPSEIRGVGSSANYSRWSPVLCLALYMELYTDQIDMLSTDDLIELAVNVEDYHNHSRDPWPRIRSRRFTHLLRHHENRAFWLPYDFEQPQFVATVILNNPGQYDFSIASSLRLKQEIEQVCEVCDRITAIRHPLTEIGIHRWEGVQDLYHMIHDAAQESLMLNLPLKILW